MKSIARMSKTAWIRHGILPLVTAALVLAMIPAAPAGAVSADSNLSITMPAFVILYYYSNISVDLTSQDFGALFTGGVHPADQGSASGTSFPNDRAITSALASGTPTATLALQNSWAVRAIGSVTVSVALTTPTLANGSDQITLSNQAVCLNGDPCSAASINFQRRGLGRPQLGDVEMDLDFTDAGASGAYTGGVFTSTATSV